MNKLNYLHVHLVVTKFSRLCNILCLARNRFSKGTHVNYHCLVTDILPTPLHLGVRPVMFILTVIMGQKKTVIRCISRTKHITTHILFSELLLLNSNLNLTFCVVCLSMNLCCVIESLFIFVTHEYNTRHSLVIFPRFLLYTHTKEKSNI